MKIYISIPKSGKSFYPQYTKAAEIAEQIKALGHEPVNPFDTPEPPEELNEKQRYAYFMGEDIKRLLMCDAILMCEGWNMSKGCSAEYSISQAYGLQRFDSIESITPQKSGLPDELMNKIHALIDEYGISFAGSVSYKGDAYIVITGPKSTAADRPQ